MCKFNQCNNLMRKKFNKSSSLIFTEISGVKLLFTRKKIKNIHLRICLPDGDVKLSAPLNCSFEKISEFVSKKSSWIKKSQNHIRKLRDEGKIILPQKFISGEEHYFFGKKFFLELVQNSFSNHAVLDENVIRLHVKKLSNFKQRQKLLDDFYRGALKKIIPDLIVKYERKMNVRVVEFGIRKMKTRWGTCNPKARRIWLNLELAKKVPEFLESIIVHEMVHFFEARHNKKFYSLMDDFMPSWKKESEV